MRDKAKTKEQLLREVAELRQQIAELETSQAQLKEAQGQLRSSREWMKIAQEAANSGLWDWDMGTGKLAWSQEFFSLFGLPVTAEPSFDTWLEAVHPEDRNAAMEGIQKSIDEHHPLQNEYRIILHNGEERWIGAIGSTFYNDDGKALRMIGICIDITERKQTEQALRRSERLYRGIGESTNYGVWVCDPDGRNIYASESFLKMVGLTQEECSSFGWGNVLHPDDAERTIAAWQECVRTEGVWDIEHRYRGVDGQYHYVLARGIPVRDEQGHITCWAGINLDIDHLKQIQEGLRKAHDELELRVQERTAQLTRQAELLDLAHDAIIVAGMDGRILFWSAGAEETYGFSKGEALGRSMPELLHIQSAIPMKEIVDMVKHRGRWEGELVHTCKDGREATVHSRWALRHDKVTGSMEILEVNRDMTVRKRAEEALRTMGAYNRSLIEASLDPLVTISPEGRINDVNSATERVTGYPRDKLIGTDFSDYFTDPKKARAGYQRVFEEGVVRDYELVIRHKDGYTTPVLYNASLYTDDEGRVIGVLAAARDISERRHLEAQLRQSQKMEALGTLAGGVAHDFNNILAAIIGFSELAKDHMAEDLRERRYIERVLQAGIRGRELVRQMLQFSRKTDQERKPLLLSGLVKEAIKLLRASIPSNISIKNTVRSESGVIMGDPVQIEQVLMNLSTNAAHAMREKGGVLDIELSDFSVSRSRGNSRDMEPGLYMKLVVRDTGSGIVPDIMDKIFDPFFTTKKTGEGTGLGLSVVMGIVKQANGYVTAESVLGKGSTFTVYFPKAEKEPGTEQAGYEDIPTGHERILFVDDEEALVEMGEDILVELGYEVVGRTN